MLPVGVPLFAEYWLFFAWRAPAYVCVDVFVYHNKGTTLKEIGPGHRGVVQ